MKYLACFTCLYQGNKIEVRYTGKYYLLYVNNVECAYNTLPKFDYDTNGLYIHIITEGIFGNDLSVFINDRQEAYLPNYMKAAKKKGFLEG